MYEDAHYIGLLFCEGLTSKSKEHTTLRDCVVIMNRFFVYSDYYE